MKAAVIVLPGSNCDRDMHDALSRAGFDTEFVWHKDSSLPQSLDLVAIPGGFSYGDYLRCGAISAHSNIISEVKSFAEKGGKILGVCNGFQILTEARLLDGALIRNKNLKFICKNVYLKAENTDTAFTKISPENKVFNISVAHHDGNFYIDADGLKSLNDNNQIAFRYCDENGDVSDDNNPNGSLENIAGIFSKNKNILGMMPHPERHTDVICGGNTGKYIFDSLFSSR